MIPGDQPSDRVAQRRGSRARGAILRVGHVVGRSHGRTDDGGGGGGGDDGRAITDGGGAAGKWEMQRERERERSEDEG